MSPKLLPDKRERGPILASRKLENIQELCPPRAVVSPHSSRSRLECPSWCGPGPLSFWLDRPSPLSLTVRDLPRLPIDDSQVETSRMQSLVPEGVAGGI